MKIPKEIKKPELIVNYKNRLYYFKHSKKEQVDELKTYLRKPVADIAVYTYRGELNNSFNHKTIRKMLTAMFRVSSTKQDNKVSIVKLSDRTVQVKDFF